MIRISSDSTCDLGGLVEEHGIEIMPLKVVLDAETYHDGKDITPNDIFAFVDKTGILPKTSAATTEEYKEFFEKLVSNGDELIHFNISSKCSVSNSCAMQAAASFGGKVRVIDSMALSSGQGLLVMRAVNLRDEGKSAAEIEEIVLGLRDKVNTSFVPDRLDYLYKGGRCSRMAMYGANLLGIHPMIDMADGVLLSKKKIRGKMKICLKSYIEDLKATYPKYDKTRCFVTHSCADRELVDFAIEKVKSEFEFNEVIETVAGSVITGHCGRNTLGVLFIAED